MRAISNAIRHAVKDFSNKNRAIGPDGRVADSEKFIHFVVDAKREDRYGRVAYSKNHAVLTTHKRSVHAGLLAYLKNQRKGTEEEGSLTLDSERRDFVYAQRSIARQFQNHADASVRQAVRFILGNNQGRDLAWERSAWEKTGFRITPELREANLVLRQALRERATAAPLATVRDSGRVSPP